MTAAGGAGAIAVDIAGRKRELRFPDSAEMRAILVKVLSGQEYPLPPFKTYRPEVILDVGANVGAAAVYFAASYPDAEIHCYEPSPQNLAFLADNVAFSQRIHVYRYGLYDDEGVARLYQGVTQTAQHSLARSIETTERFEEVTLRRASAELSALGARRISILKLDTEGSELPILHDLAGWFDRIDYVYVEYHSEADRREIDSLLGAMFELCYARADRLHRGMNVYMSLRLKARYPAVDLMKIDRRRLELTPAEPGT